MPTLNGGTIHTGLSGFSLTVPMRKASRGRVGRVGTLRAYAYSVSRERPTDKNSVRSLYVLHRKVVTNPKRRTIAMGQLQKETTTIVWVKYGTLIVTALFQQHCTYGVVTEIALACSCDTRRASRGPYKLAFRWVHSINRPIESIITHPRDRGYWL